MTSIEQRILQGLLWFAAASHLVIGGGIVFSAEFQRALAPVYSAEVQWTPQMTYILRPLGAFMFVFGILIAISSFDPLRHRSIVYGLCGVLFLRAVQRVLFYPEAQEAFGINLGWYFAMGAFFLAMACAMILLVQRLSRHPMAAGSPAHTS